MPDARWVIVFPAHGCFIDEDDRRGYGSYTWPDLLAALRRVLAYYRRTGEDASGLRVEMVTSTGERS